MTLSKNLLQALRLRQQQSRAILGDQHFILGADANSEATQSFGEAPAVKGACDPDVVAKATKAIDYPADPGFCDEYHANDPDFWKKVYYWITPVADCGDDRGSVCKDNNDWIQAWTEIKG